MRYAAGAAEINRCVVVHQACTPFMGGARVIAWVGAWCVRRVAEGVCTVGAKRQLEGVVSFLG